MSNLGNESDVKKRNEEIKNRETIQLLELKKLLEQKAFRNFIWRWLGLSRAFTPGLWVQSAEIHCRAAVRDFGMDLWNELEKADQEAVFQMMRENKKPEEKENA